MLYTPDQLSNRSVGRADTNTRRNSHDESTLGASLPSVLGALAILIVGWLVAIVVRAGIRRGLALVCLDERIRSSAGLSFGLGGREAAGRQMEHWFSRLRGEAVAASRVGRVP
jgi:hypothetical protein